MDDFKIYYWMCNCGIRDKELMAYAVIYHYSKKERGSVFNKGQSFFKKLYGWTRPTIRKALDSLIEKGAIIKLQNPDPQSNYSIYSLNYEFVRKNIF